MPSPRNTSSDQLQRREPDLLPDTPGILDCRTLPDSGFDKLWQSVIIDQALKDRLLAQAVLNFTARSHLQTVALPIHGLILLVGPPGTGKTSLARGLASRTAASLNVSIVYMEVDPHALASAALGKSQQAVCHLLGTVVGERAASGRCIVLLDEVEALAADRSQMSLQANPVDVHRATDAVLAQLDQLAANNPSLLFLATSNFPGAIDEAFVSRADMVMSLGLPTPEACRAIFADTIERLAVAYPRIAEIKADPVLATAAERSIGLDGRRIRKAVVAALAQTKEIAMHPDRLTSKAILAAIEAAKAEQARMERR